MAETLTFSSLDDARTLSQNRQTNQVQFMLDEETPLEEASKIRQKTRPGLRGFRMLNPELLDCKADTRNMLNEVFKQMLRECMTECDDQLAPLNTRIAELKEVMRTPDDQIPEVGPPLAQRGQGLQQVIYLHTPYPGYEFSNAGPDVPYDPPYATGADRNAARDRDLIAQKAWWELNLSLLETKKRFLENKKIELEKALREEFDKAMEKPSELGVGYTNYTFRHRN